MTCLALVIQVSLTPPIVYPVCITETKATWLSGHALSQTLFTSCYVLHLNEIRGTQIDEPESVRFVSKVLKPCVLAIAKSCGFIWTEMKKGQTYDEEDFMINKFGVSLYENFPFGSTVALLDEAEQWMETSGKRWIDSQYGSEAADILGAVLTRIHFARVCSLRCVCESRGWDRHCHTLTPGQLISPPILRFIKSPLQTAQCSLKLPGTLRRCVSTFKTWNPRTRSVPKWIRPLTTPCIGNLSVTRLPGPLHFCRSRKYVQHRSESFQTHYTTTIRKEPFIDAFHMNDRFYRPLNSWTKCAKTSYSFGKRSLSPMQPTWW